MYWTIYLKGSPPRVNHAAVAVENKIYSFGGYTSEEVLPVSIDVHAFDTVTLTWWPVKYKNEAQAPNGIYGHSVVAHGQKIYLWGGQNGYFTTNKLYCFDVDCCQWSMPHTSGQDPKAADGHSACVIDNYMYIFGGYELESERFRKEVYRIDLNTYVWELLNIEGAPPFVRDFHTASVIGDRMYIFGGRSYKNGNELGEEFYCNAIKYLDTKSMCWVTPVSCGNIPCGRRSHSASVYNNEIYIIGGYEGITQSHLNDIHKFNPVRNEWTKIIPQGQSPIPRRRHCSCVVDDHLYLFGGSSPNETYNIFASGVLSAFSLNSERNKLYEHKDLHVLDFFPTLKRLSQLKVIENKYRIDLKDLPKTLRDELESMTYKDVCTEALDLVIPNITGIEPHS